MPGLCRAPRPPAGRFLGLLPSQWLSSGNLINQHQRINNMQGYVVTMSPLVTFSNRFAPALSARHSLQVLLCTTLKHTSMHYLGTGLFPAKLEL